MGRDAWRGQLPDGHEWLTTEQAAALWNSVIGLGPKTINRPISGQKLRLMCRSGALADLGIVVVDMPGRYYISRQSLLERLHEVSCAACKRAEAELRDK